MQNQQIWLIVLQSLQVVFLWLHDWIPLGTLNDVAAVRRQDPLRRLIVVTLIQSIPFTIGLVFSIYHLNQPFPGWLRRWLWISYGILFVGQLRAWWLPYLLNPDPSRSARYKELFGSTHAFLPQRNGMVPNTAHIFLHVLTLVTLLLLWASRTGA